MIRALRLLVSLEAAIFVLAATIHFGALLDGYDHRKAAIAETVIAVVLLAGLVASFSERRALVAAQAFGVFGVLIGLLTIAVGVGPRTVLDVAYHVAILAVLATGTAMAARTAGALPAR